MAILRVGLAVVSLIFAAYSFAAIDTYEFTNDEGRERFHTLNNELRCPKCQNQNLADSNSPIASDLRREVHRMIEAGKSDDDIMNFMVTRYGEFVLYKPRKSNMTWALWYGPFVLLAIGVVVVLMLGKRRRNTADSDRDAEHAVDSTALSEQEQSRLDQLLNKKDPS
jgi:cytochrome c-type biogenesis protein CcmH